MTILDKSQNDKKDELIVNGNVIPTSNVILSEAERSREDLNPSVMSTEVETSHPNVMSTEVETSHPQCHPESVAKRSREDLNPTVMSTEVEGELTAPLSSRASSRDLPNNVISTEVEKSHPTVIPTEVEESNPNEENEVMELDFIEGDDFSDDWDDEVEEETKDENDESSDDELLTDLPEGMDEVLKNIEKYSKESYDDEDSSSNVILSEAERSREDLNPSVIPTAVETSNPQCHPESVAERSREDLNPNVIPSAVEGELTAPLSSRASSRDLSNSDENAVETSNPTVISTEVQRSGEILAEPDGDEIIDEAALEEKYSELESVRESAETIDAEMADLSYLEDLKKKTEPQELSAEEKKTQKQKQAEERKRKRQEENDLFARRYKAKSINAAVAQSNPIIYFYNAILTKKGKIQLFNVYQVLQDRFLGKLVPQLWMAVAEASDRVLELNMANLIEQIKVCEKYPEYEFILQMSTRFFTKPAVLEKMTALIDHPVPNLVMSFDCVSLQNLGTAAKTGLAAIKEKGVKIVLDNTEKVSMTTLSELDFDYLRLDSRYYELGNFKSEGFLRLLTGFAKELGIPTIAMFCDDQDMVEYMLYMGVDMVQGNAVSRPMRTIPNALGAVTPVESMLIEDETVGE